MRTRRRYARRRWRMRTCGASWKANRCARSSWSRGGWSMSWFRYRTLQYCDSRARRRRAANCNIAKSGTCLLLLLVLGACGFHRQGVVPLSPVIRNTYIDAHDARTGFQLELRRSLEASGANLVPSASNASATLHIHKDETGRRVLSVSAANTPREYEVYYAVEYSVTAADEELLPPQQLELTRNYSFDEARLLAKEEEE